METFRIEDIVKKLLGEISPVGETNTDQIRLVNLSQTINLAYELIDQIIEVSKESNRHEHSIKTAGLKAKDFIKNLKDTLSDVFPDE